MKLGVSVVAFVITPGVPDAPVMLVHTIELASDTVTKLGKVKVSAHIVISLNGATIVGFLLIKMVIASVTATCGQAAFGIADIVKVTEEVSAEPRV